MAVDVVENIRLLQIVELVATADEAGGRKPPARPDSAKKIRPEPAPGPPQCATRSRGRGYRSAGGNRDVLRRRHAETLRARRDTRGRHAPPAETAGARTENARSRAPRRCSAASPVRSRRPVSRPFARSAPPYSPRAGNAGTARQSRAGPIIRPGPAKRNAYSAAARVASPSRSLMNSPRYATSAVISAASRPAPVCGKPGVRPCTAPG